MDAIEAVLSSGAERRRARIAADAPHVDARLRRGSRRRLAELAHGADVLFCESTFRAVDADRAERTGHLTARACGEIATAANVARLVPFHFSRRYEADPSSVYREVKAACSNAVVPRPPKLH